MRRLDHKNFVVVVLSTRPIQKGEKTTKNQNKTTNKNFASTYINLIK